MDGNNLHDLRGLVYGELRAVRILGRSRRYAVWLCECSCGAEVRVRSDKLVSGRRVFCTWRVHGRKACRGLSPSGIRSNRLTYNSWKSMRERCESKDHKNYDNYGGRGIFVCERWRLSFAAFLEDMGSRPGSEYSIERDDVNGNYEAGNCRWATDREQRRNKRSTTWVEWGGERRRLVDLCEEREISGPVVRGRLKMGWSLARALVTPVRKKACVKS
jgi:hypothetical protein